jgi:hypothetical protein
MPSRITRGGPIAMRGPLTWEKSRALETLVHYTCKDDPVVVSYMVGQGQVIWWASSLPLTNQGIRDKNNLNLLINSLDERKHILWDEYFQGEEKRQLRVFPPAVKWALVAQSLAFAAMLLFTFSRRSGPVIPLVPESRLSPLEFVDTLGNLYQRAAAAQVPVEIAFTRFRQLAARRLGLFGNIKAQQLSQAMRQRRLVSDKNFDVRLLRAEEAISDPSLTEKEALALVQFLNQAAEALDVTSAVFQEKRNAGDTTGSGALPK